MSAWSGPMTRFDHFPNTIEVLSTTRGPRELPHLPYYGAPSLHAAPPPVRYLNTIPLPPSSPDFVTHSPLPSNSPPTTLHTLLLFSFPGLIFDLSIDPVIPTVHSQLHELATSPPLPKLIIVCSSLPWAISISTSLLGKNKFLTVEDVIYGLYWSLRAPVPRTEYKDVERMDPKRSLSADKAFTRRWQRLLGGNAEQEYMKGVKRVDYLGPRRRFQGLSLEEEPNVFRLHTL